MPEGHELSSVSKTELEAGGAGAKPVASASAPVGRFFNSENTLKLGSLGLLTILAILPVSVFLYSAFVTHPEAGKSHLYVYELHQDIRHFRGDGRFAEHLDHCAGNVNYFLLDGRFACLVSCAHRYAFQRIYGGIDPDSLFPVFFFGSHRLVGAGRSEDGYTESAG